MEANKKLNAALNAVFNSAEYNELHRVVMELRDNGGVELHPDTARNVDVLAQDGVSKHFITKAAKELLNLLGL